MTGFSGVSLPSLNRIYSNDAVNVASGNTLTIASSITGYKKLLLVWNLQGTDGAVGTTNNIIFNADAGANYSYHNIVETTLLTGQSGIRLGDSVRTAIMCSGYMLIDVVDSGAGNIHGVSGNGQTHGNNGVNHFVKGGTYVADGDINQVQMVVTGTGNTTGTLQLYGIV